MTTKKQQPLEDVEQHLRDEVAAALNRLEAKHVLWAAEAAIDGMKQRIKHTQDEILRLRAFPDQELGAIKERKSEERLLELNETLRVYYRIMRFLGPLRTWLMHWNVSRTCEGIDLSAIFPRRQ